MPRLGLWRGETVARRCPSCASPRLVAHAELERLAIAHLDCDAFYASVEKRDRPELADQPVIVGGGVRGVVTTCCYIARTFGVRSAMPMFKARKLCPDAVIIKPDFAKYTAASRAIMASLRALTPLVQPLSLDEAWLDLSGTERLNGGPPAWQLARVQVEIERATGLTVSVGLASNKFLAKIASDLDKPRGFAVIGAQEAQSFLSARPVAILPGVGPALARSLEAAGFSKVGDLAAVAPKVLADRFGRPRPALGGARPRRGHSRGGPGVGAQGDQRGDHLQRRPDRSLRARGRAVALLRKGGRPGAGRRASPAARWC